MSSSFPLGRRTPSFRRERETRKPKSEKHSVCPTVSLRRGHLCSATPRARIAKKTRRGWRRRRAIQDVLRVSFLQTTSVHSCVLFFVISSGKTEGRSATHSISPSFSALLLGLLLLTNRVRLLEEQKWCLAVAHPAAAAAPVRSCPPTAGTGPPKPKTKTPAAP